MIVRMLGPTIGEAVALSSYLVNGTTLVDCGGAGVGGDFARQAAVRNIFLTHAHLDHVASLPILLDNVYGSGTPPVVHGSAATLDILQRDLFNDRLWPDFIALSQQLAPFLQVRKFQDGVVVGIPGMTVEPVAVDHVIPTSAFILQEPGTAAAIVTDTAPTHDIWRRLARTPNLRAVLLECSFPDELAGLAVASKHLTPTTFAAEAAQLPAGVRLLAVHLKPQHHARIARELAVVCPRAEIVRPEHDYSFGAGVA